MIQKMTYPFPFRGQDRQLHIYLPDDYQEDKSYPVMYMLDGHNLFYHRDATYGRSWALKHYMDQADRQMIIVGIECDHDYRIEEYTPYYLEEGFRGEPIQGYGKEFMDWLVQDLKPFIDKEYSTFSQREATGIGGSSMGGLMAFYALIAYNDYFSKGAALSPALGICADQLDQEMNQKQLDSDSRVYFSYGKREIKGRPDALGTVQHFNNRIIDAGGQAYIHIQPNGFHNENTWRKQNSRYMEFLWD